MDPLVPQDSRLDRRLGTFDAVLIGLGSMIGAGIFVAIGPAIEAAGAGLLIGLAVAAGIAYLNATSSAQLAALYPRSGGTYVYGRERLGDAWGFLAGWCFVVGKIASCGAIALTFGSYAFPSFDKGAAALAVIVLTSVNYGGVRKTALMTRLIVAFVVTALAIVVGVLFATGEPHFERLTPVTGDGGVPGILQAAGFMFFAFAGYARIATLGEEVKDPQRTIPRAMPLALGLVIVLYGTVAVSALATVPQDRLGSSSAPLATALRSIGSSGFVPLVTIAAAVASLGVLLSLLAGVARTVFEMASRGDLPALLDAVHPKHKVPHRAEAAVGVAVALLVLLGDIRNAIGFSAVTVLTYYAITNAAAFTLGAAERRWPRWMSIAGLGSCLVVAANLPAASLLAGSLVVLFGLAVYLGRRRRAG